MADELKGRVFTKEEVNAVLSRAVERQNPSPGGLTYAELIDSARQAGIDPGAIDAAVQELAGRKETAAEDKLVQAEVARRQWKSWRAFSIHFTIFVMFGVLITTINVHEGGEQFWPIPILTWGIFIAAHFIGVFFPAVFPNPDRFEDVRRELRKRDEQRRKREHKERRKGELKESAQQLGVAVQRGMATILSDVAKTIHEEVDRANRGEPGREVRVETKARVAEADEGREDEENVERGGRAGKRR